jgi:hypothetical protein
VCIRALGEMVFCIPLYSLDLALICFSQKFAKGGDCWVFVLAALLLKQISMFVMLDAMVQHVLDVVLDDVSTCPFCSGVTFLHGCGLKKCMC